MRRPRLKVLSNLLSKIPVITKGEIPEVKIRAVSSDSRQVQPGDAFFAIRGESFDGFDYIPSAIERGAALIIGNRPAPKNPGVPYLEIDDDPRKALAWLAAATHNFPARKLRMIGVTGTDGKTSTSSMIHHILTQSGVQSRHDLHGERPDRRPGDRYRLSRHHPQIHPQFRLTWLRWYAPA